MRIIRHLPEEAHDTVLAIGNFDGVHIGHQAVLNTAFRIGAAEGMPCSVLTFYPHPRRYFRPDLPVLSICRPRQKWELLAQGGVKTIYHMRFNAALAGMEAHDFAESLLHRRLRVRHVVTGEGFVFGKGRGGNAEVMRDAAARCGFFYTAVAPVTDASGEVCSSTRIRGLLSEGRVEAAAVLLGRAYALEGRVVHGDGRGRTIGYPTANVALPPLYLPAHGVYAVQLRANGTEYNAVANLGVRPTFGGVQPRLEVHCLDANPDLYGVRAHISFIHRIRGERRFENGAALARQIACDIESARAIHAKDI